MKYKKSVFRPSIFWFCRVWDKATSSDTRKLLTWFVALFETTLNAGLPMKYDVEAFSGLAFLVLPGLGYGYKFRYAKTADLVRGLIRDHKTRRFVHELHR